MRTRVVVTIIVRGTEAPHDEATLLPYTADVETDPAKRTTQPPVGWPLDSTTVRMGGRRRLLVAGAATLVAALLVATAVMRHSESDPAASSVPASARTSATELATVNSNVGSALGPAELAAVNSGVGSPLGPANPVRPELREPHVGPPNVWSAAVSTTAGGSPPDPAADATSCRA